ncbi:MAG: DUF3566 domain-containing protein [Candidatus Latescibacterota bacterium]
MDYELRRIEIWSVVKVAFFVCAILGFFPGIALSLLLWVFSSVIRAFVPGEMGDISGSSPTMFTMAVILAPLFGAIGAVLAGIAAALYNLLARWIGGVQFRLDAIQAEAAGDAESAPCTAPDGNETHSVSP